MEDSGNEISKYELNRFLGERTSLNKNENEKEKLEIKLLDKNIDLLSIVFNFENKNYFVNNDEFGEFESLLNFNNIILSRTC